MPTKALSRDAIASHLLVVRCQAGDDKAFSELYRQFAGRTLSYLRRFQDGVGADDLQQEVWIAVYSGIGGLSRPAAFKTWLFQITRNRAMDLLRIQRRREALLAAASPVPEVGWSDQAEEIAGVDLEALQSAMQGLSQTHQEVLHLRYWEDMSYSAIALIVGQPVGTVRSRLHHAKKQLALQIEQKLHRHMDPQEQLRPEEEE